MVFHKIFLRKSVFLLVVPHWFKSSNKVTKHSCPITLCCTTESSNQSVAWASSSDVPPVQAAGPVALASYWPANGEGNTGTGGRTPGQVYKGRTPGPV